MEFCGTVIFKIYHSFFIIYLFIFAYSNDVNIFCNLHTCRVTCHHVPCNEQRQRRNVIMFDNDDNNEIHTINSNFHVQNNGKAEYDEEV